MSFQTIQLPQYSVNLDLAARCGICISSIPARVLQKNHNGVLYIPHQVRGTTFKQLCVVNTQMTNGPLLTNVL